MSFTTYLRNGVWDLILCIIASSALSFTVCSAFYATQPYQGQPYIIVLGCAVLCAIMFCLGYNKTLSLGGSVAFAVAMIGCIGICFTVSPTEGLLDDEAGNLVLLALMIILPSVLVFVLSRKKTTTCILLAVGVVLCAVIEYLYWYGHLVSFLLFVIATVALIAYRSYAKALRGSDTDTLAFAPVAATGVCVGLAASLLACGIFLACIAPFNPPNMIVKLVTQHVRLDEELVRGTGDAISVQNDHLFSMNTNDLVQQSNGDNGQNPQQQNMENTMEGDKDAENNAGSALNLGDRSDKDSGEAIRMNIPTWFWVAFPIVIVALIVAVFVVRKLLRRRRYNNMTSLEPSQQVQALYLFFMKRLAKLGVSIPDGQTPQEFVAASSSQLARFEQVPSQPAFAKLTDTYTRCVYGNMQPSDEELGAFNAYYNSFYKNFRKMAGGLKYLVLFFRV